MVNEHMHTTANGFYACGNCLHVHDSVDVLVREAAVAGKAAALASVMGLPAEAKASRGLEVTAGKNVSYVVPQWVETAGIFDLALRPSGLIKKPVYLKVLADGKEVFKKRLPCALPSTMVRVRATLTSEVIGPCEWLEVTLDEQRT